MLLVFNVAPDESVNDPDPWINFPSQSSELLTIKFLPEATGILSSSVYAEPEFSVQLI
jgi:hypothetical protein